MQSYAGRMLLAAERGDTTGVMAQLERGAEIDSQDEFGFTVLHWAIRTENRALVHHLLPLGPDLERRDARGNTALIWAVRGRDREIIDALLNAGADPTARDVAGHTLLHLAAAGGDLVLIDRLPLPESGIDTVDACRDTPLTLAATNGRHAAVLALADRGADIDWRGNGGRTALLHTVMDHGSPETAPLRTSVITSLLLRGADVNRADDAGWTPLMRAANHGDVSLCHLLLEHGADIAAQDAQGLTAFHWAARGRHLPILQLLLDAGAAIDAQDEEKRTALFQQMRDPDPQIVAFLLDHGADATVTNENGDSALFAAAQGGQLDIVRLLIDHGAEIDHRNGRGETVLDDAVRNRRDDIAHELLSLSATTTIPLIEAMGYLPETIDQPDDREWTPLARAVRDGYGGRMHLLLDAGARIDIADRRGVTPLMLAAAGYTDGLLEALLKRGADPEARDLSGATPLHHAVRGQRPERVRALLAYGVNTNAHDHAGRTPRMLAGELHLPEIQALLPQKPRSKGRERKFGGDWPTMTDTPALHRDIHHAGWFGDTALLTIRLNEGVRIDARSHCGATPLMYAAGAGHREIVDLLLERGADPNAHDDDGDRALEWAVHCDQTPVADLLRDRMGIVETVPETAGPDWRGPEW